jgi:hypothetical protein
MPWLPLYLLDSDIDLLNAWLCKDQDVYFIKQVDKNHWKLVKELKFKKEGFSNEYRLWHLPSGQIPLIKERSLSEGVPIESLFKRATYDHVLNPFEPWSGRPCSNLSGLPFFEDDETKVFTLTIYNSNGLNHEIRISGFEWLGNRYSIIGKGAEESTEKWWRRLRNFVKKNSIQIPRCNDSSMKKEIYTFPKAIEAIKNGRPCSLN